TDATVFYCFTCVSLLGTVAAYYNILSILGADSLIRVFRNNTANDLRAALYTGYSIGPASLRYCSALSGGISMFRVVSGRVGISDILAQFALIGASAISGR